MKTKLWLILILAAAALTACSNPISSTANADFSASTPRSIYCYNLPATFEAEAYSASAGVETGYNPTNYIQSVGWFDRGDWVDYPIYVPVEGEYTFEFRLASAVSSGQFDVQFGGETIRRTDSSAHWGIARIDVPNTGGWDNWTTVTMKSWIARGQKTLRLWAGGAGFNVDTIKIFPTNGLVTRFSIPATIEPESFIEYKQAMGYPLQARVSQDGTVYAVMNYRSKFGTSVLRFTIDVPETRTYSIVFRTASYYASKLGFWVDQGLSSVTNLASTGNSDEGWVETQASASLTAGVHEISIESYGQSYIDGAPFNLDSVKFY